MVVNLPTQEELIAWAKEQFVCSADCPFKSEAYEVLRAANKKWFALFMDVPAGYIDHSLSVEDTRERALVVNVKVAKPDIAAVLGFHGVYPAYHMNKDHWVSVVVSADVLEVATLDLVHELIGQSYELVRPRMKKRSSTD